METTYFYTGTDCLRVQAEPEPNGGGHSLTVHGLERGDIVRFRDPGFVGGDAYLSTRESDSGTATFRHVIAMPGGIWVQDGAQRGAPRYFAGPGSFAPPAPPPVQAAAPVQAAPPPPALAAAIHADCLAAESFCLNPDAEAAVGSASRSTDMARILVQAFVGGREPTAVRALAMLETAGRECSAAARAAFIAILDAPDDPIIAARLEAARRAELAAWRAWRIFDPTAPNPFAP